MKIVCACGAWIFDGTDRLPHKAHFIPDQAWDALAETLEAEVVDALVDGTRSREAAYMKVRTLLNAASRSMYQCRSCRRLYVEDALRQNRTFEPVDPQKSRGLLTR